MGEVGPHWTDFHEIWHLNSFKKSVEKNSSCIPLRMRDVSDKICRKNQNTNFMFNNISFRKYYRLRDNVEKYYRTGQATDENKAHAYCMRDT
jgi:hypothetical protein